MIYGARGISEDSTIDPAGVRARVRRRENGKETEEERFMPADGIRNWRGPKLNGPSRAGQFSQKGPGESRPRDGVTILKRAVNRRDGVRLRKYRRSSRSGRPRLLIRRESATLVLFSGERKRERGGRKKPMGWDA